MGVGSTQRVGVNTAVGEQQVMSSTCSECPAMGQGNMWRKYLILYFFRRRNIPLVWSSGQQVPDSKPTKTSGNQIPGSSWHSAHSVVSLLSGCALLW